MRALWDVEASEEDGGGNLRTTSAVTIGNLIYLMSSWLCFHPGPGSHRKQKGTLLFQLSALPPCFTFLLLSLLKSVNTHSSCWFICCPIGVKKKKKKQLNQPQTGGSPSHSEVSNGSEVSKWSAHLVTEALRSHWSINNKRRQAHGFSLKSSKCINEGDGAHLFMASLFITSRLLVQQHSAFCAAAAGPVDCVLGPVGSFFSSPLWSSDREVLPRLPKSSISASNRRNILGKYRHNGDSQSVWLDAANQQAWKCFQYNFGMYISLCHCSALLITHVLFGPSSNVVFFCLFVCFLIESWIIRTRVVPLLNENLNTPDIKGSSDIKFYFLALSIIYLFNKMYLFI